MAKVEWNEELAELEAYRAGDELGDMMREDEAMAKAVPLLADWWRRHYMVAGHKRLGRALMGVK